MTSAGHVAGIGIVTGWGEGVAALPDDARLAGGGRRVVAIETPRRDGDRFRRATRECLLGVVAVEAALRDAGWRREDIAGPDTALVYVTAAAYGASNRAFLDGAAGARAVHAAGRGALHFPYTAPSAVPAEVAIEFHLTGSYVILVGGAPTTLDALWQASTLIERGAARRALVLAVETFAECADLWGESRRLVASPLVEAAACALVLPSTDGRPGRAIPETAAAPSRREEVARRRAGETLACGPLIALALTDVSDSGEVTGAWRGRRSRLRWMQDRRAGSSAPAGGPGDAKNMSSRDRAPHASEETR